MVGMVMTKEKVELLAKVSVLLTIVYVHHHCLKYCTKFTVTDFCNLYSDVHSPITVSISGQSTVNLESEHGCNYSINLNNEDESAIKWDISKSDQFNKRIDPIKIINLKADIDKVVNSDISTIDQPTVNLFVDRLCDLFLSSAKETFGTVKSR